MVPWGRKVNKIFFFEVLHVYQSIFMLIQQGHFQKRDNGIFSKPTGRQPGVQDTLYDRGSDSIQSPLPPWKASEMLYELLLVLYLQEPHRAVITADFSPLLSLESFLIFLF